MNELVIVDIPSNTQEELEILNRGVAEMQACEQVEIETKSTIHAGIYCRTCKVPKGVAIAGALIKIPTIIHVVGDFSMTVGGKSARYAGYHIFKAAAGRRQFFLAHEDTFISMTFATQAKTLDEAEKEFTDEFNQLLSRGE